MPKKSPSPFALDKLKPHPRQSAPFSAPEHEVRELADDIERNGLKVPIEILPDGTILTGHKRVAAAQLLDWKEIDACVRSDLKDDPEAAERLLIEDNLNRRQMGPIAVARCYRRIKQRALLEDRRRRGYELRENDVCLNEHARRDIRDRIGKRFGMSGRTLDRYVRVLEMCPERVLAAVEANTLSMQTAEKVAGLPSALRDDIDERIREGTPPKEAAEEVLAEMKVVPRDSFASKINFLRALYRGLEVFGDDLSSFAGTTARQIEILQNASHLIKRILQEVKADSDAKPA